MPYALALAVTLLVEVPVYVMALRAGGAASGWRAFAAALGVNLVTHPLVWLVVSGAGSAYWASFAAAEVLAWLIESAILLVWLRRDPVLIGLVALVANAGSCLTGLLLLETV